MPKPWRTPLRPPTSVADSARLAQEKYHARDRKIVDLRARIQTAGGSGVGENLAMANARIELLERQEKDFLDKERAMAQRHQIFLFTCHPELWNDLGVEQRALEELKAAA